MHLSTSVRSKTPASLYLLVCLPVPPGMSLATPVPPALTDKELAPNCRRPPAMQDSYSDESSDEQWQSQEVSGRPQQQRQARANRAGPDTDESGDSEEEEAIASARPSKRQKQSAAGARPAALQQAAGAGGSNQAAQLKVRRQREQAFDCRQSRAAEVGVCFSAVCWLRVQTALAA